MYQFYVFYIFQVSVRSNNLLAMPVGIKQKKNVDIIVQKVQPTFDFKIIEKIDTFQ